MNLTDIAKKIISEDSWGMNPSAGGSMAPGRSPTAVSPGPTARRVNISNLYKNFKLELEKQEDALIQKLEADLKKSFLKKLVTVKASKGSVGQIEKEYNVSVNNVDVRYMKDKYYIVFTGKEGNASDSEYYLDDSIISVDDAPASISTVGRTGGMSAPEDGTAGKRNILPQG
jgi:hypothetical protein